MADSTAGRGSSSGADGFSNAAMGAAGKPNEGKA
jgi:hypothetical protein